MVQSHYNNRLHIGRDVLRYRGEKKTQHVFQTRVDPRNDEITKTDTSFTNITIFLSWVRPLACSNFIMVISFLDVTHLFYLCHYTRRRSSEFVIHSLFVDVLLNVSFSCLKNITPWSRGLLENPTVSQLVMKFPAFYVTRRFITAFTRARHLPILSQLNRLKNIPS
jgi:hypothetical protein